MFTLQRFVLRYKDLFTLKRFVYAKDCWVVKWFYFLYDNDTMTQSYFT
jgi:hypothetical protein